MAIETALMRTALAIMLMLSTASAACEGMTYGPQAWANSWQQVAFIALLIGFFIVGMIYAIGMGFSMPKLVASAKKDLMYLLFIAVLAGSLAVIDDIMNNTFLPAFATQSLIDATATRQSVTFCSYGGMATWGDLQQHSIDYVECLREKSTTYFEALMNINFILGFVSSITLVITPLELIGLSFTPGAALKPMIDTLGYGLYMLAINIAQLKTQEVFLCFSRYYMFRMVLPVGIALSALPITRSAGGTLIAIAIGFYFVLPVTYLLSEEIVYDYCLAHGGCSFSSSSLAIAAQFMGSGRDLVEDMFESGGASSSRLVDTFSLDGPMGPMIYVIGIASMLLPMVSMLVTLMFVKAFSRIFGAEADFSAMIKIL
ncbi:MAG: hypothetical protein ABIG39_04005 [Candidatus Micrarchaeota archaeon]